MFTPKVSVLARVLCIAWFLALPWSVGGAVVVNPTIHHFNGQFDLPLSDIISGTTMASRQGVAPETVYALRRLGMDWGELQAPLQRLSAGIKHLQNAPSGQSATVGSLGTTQLAAAIGEVFGSSPADTAAWLQLGATPQETLYLYYIADVFGISQSTALDEARTLPWSQVQQFIADMTVELSINVDHDDAQSRVVSSTPTLLSESIIKDPASEYDLSRQNPFQPYFKDFNETVSPAAGSLTINQTDMSLPGRNGFDLVVRRVYSSSQAVMYERAWSIDPDMECSEYGCSVGYL